MKGFIRCALYARVSSQKQADEMTIDSQIAALRDRIRRDGFEVEARFEFCDAGYSGAELRRPAMEDLRDAVASGAVDRVYVYDPDRFARKLAHQAILLEEFAKQGCELIFLSQDGIPNTPESNLLIQLQGMIAEYEREKILERTRRGRRYAAKQGKLSVFSSAPFGYRRIPKQPSGPETHWEVDPTAAAVVRLIFELVGIQRYPLGRVQRELFARGIRTATGKEQWNRATVRDILLNPAYQGTAKYGRERLMPRKPGRRAKRGDPRVPRRSKVAKPTLPEEQETILVPSIVDAKLFEAVGEIMAENRKRERERKGGSKYLLSGLLVCGCCQHAYCARKTHHSRMIYRCLGGDRYRRLNKPLCDNPCVDGEALEQRVWDELCELLQNPERIKEELQRRRNQNLSETPKLQQLETKVATLRGRLDRLIDAHTLGHIERSEFESRVSVFRGQYNRELKALENLRGKVQDERDGDWVANSLNTLAKQVAEGLAQAQFSLKRELLKLLISVIEIYKDEIRIVYRVPSRPFLQSPDKSGQLQHCLLRPVARDRARMHLLSIASVSAIPRVSRQSTG